MGNKIIMVLFVIAILLIPVVIVKNHERISGMEIWNVLRFSDGNDIAGVVIQNVDSSIRVYVFEPNGLDGIPLDFYLNQKYGNINTLEKKIERDKIINALLKTGLIDYSNR